MTPEQITLVKESWSKVVPIAAVAADLFYGKLFELDPALRPLFPEDLSEQKQKLMQMLGRVVSSLHDPAILEPVKDLGRRHVAYGVKDEHYATVGAALLWTLGQGLKDAFTDDVKEAWTAAYTTLSTTMISAAQQAA